MPKMGYDISKIEGIFSRMIASDTFPSTSLLNELKKEINAFFVEARCIDVIYTRNTDNLFFGMQVMPVLEPTTTLKIILDDDSVKIDKYNLEIDSKLFQIGLEKREITAILLHEIGHIVTNDLPTKQVRAAVDMYFANRDEIINLKNSTQYTALLTFAVQDIIRKANSFIYMSSAEVQADAFVTMCGYGADLESALNKIATNAYGLTKSVKDQKKLTVLAWIVNLYTNVKLNRIPAIHTMQKAKHATGSVLTKKEIDNVIKALNKIDTDIIRESAILIEGVHKNTLAGHIKKSGYKAMDADYYEYKIRVRNLNDEADMIYVLRQLNSRLTIIGDTLEEEMSDVERAKWQDLYSRYLDLRSQVSTHKINKRQYGLWYDYDELDDEQKKYSMYS